MRTSFIEEPDVRERKVILRSLSRISNEIMINIRNISIQMKVVEKLQ